MCVEIREHDHNDDLDSREIAFINSSEGGCPLCCAGDLIGGPRGGICQNFVCDACLSEFNLTLLEDDRQQFVLDGHHLRKPSGREAYQLQRLRDRWGILDNDPPPGVSAEQWAQIEAEATETLDKLGRDPGETAGPSHSE